MANLDYQATSGANTSSGVASDDVQISELRQQYLDWAGAKTAEIDEQRESRHYYHGDQHTSGELQKLQLRGQPRVTFNRVNRKVDGVVGTLKKLWQDAKAYPRSPNADQDAEVATSAIKYVLDTVRWKSVGVEGTRNAAREGIGVVAFSLKPGDKGDADLGLEIIENESWFYDPRSVKSDFSDCQYMGESKWLDLDVAKSLYPDKAEALDGLISSGGDVDTVAQSDRQKNWVNIKSKRLRVVEHWYKRAAAWHVCHYTGNTKLAGAPSPWADEKGESQSKYVAFSAYVDHDGDRYGFVRNLKSPQDEINQRRSKALFMLNSRRLVGKGHPDNIETIRKEAARPDGVVLFPPGSEIEFEDAVSQQQWQGQMEMLVEAKSEIENYGPTLADKADAKSGRALNVIMQMGLSELGPFVESWVDWKLRVYRFTWNGARKNWTAERMVRVTDDEGAAKFVRLNGLQIDQFGQPQMVNQVSALDVDIILDEAPDSVNTMQDVFELLESLAAAGVPVPPAVVIEMSGLPASVKKKVIGMIEQAQQPDPMAEEAKKAELRGVNAKAAQAESAAQKNIADAAGKWAETSMHPDRMAHEHMNSDRQHEVAMQKQMQQPQAM